MTLSIDKGAFVFRRRSRGRLRAIIRFAQAHVLSGTLRHAEVTTRTELIMPFDNYHEGR